ncbi:YceD family protein [Neptuniibacter halophilus]|uniref:YceD family protein n=1 Tax=Neptuniibacter halophilus TaxID=651666 RepID=UPI002573DCFA|nr:YceD family protein [Neptuniibacter halophilus]
MSNGPLPNRVDPRKLAERGVRISGEAGVKSLPNLCQSLVDKESVIDVDLQFSVDEQRIRTVTGSASGRLFMTCQRCLEPVEVAVAAEFNLGIAASEEAAKQLPRSYDPLIVEAEEIELLPVIEEEVILSLPFDAYHDDCSIKTSFGKSEAAVEETEKPNPFSVLAQLKADNK